MSVISKTISKGDVTLALFYNTDPSGDESYGLNVYDSEGIVGGVDITTKHNIGDSDYYPNGDVRVEAFVTPESMVSGQYSGALDFLQQNFEMVLQVLKEHQPK